MLLLVIILFIKVSNTQKEQENIVYIDYKVVEYRPTPQQDKPEPERRANSSNRQARNIAVNQEDKIEKYDDYKNYKVSDRSAAREAQGRISQAVKEIIRDNNLNPNDKELPKVESKPIDFYKPAKIEESQVYKGPTNISFKLDNRKVAYLPVPVYKCKGGATVQVDIRVGQRGIVELTTINRSGTDTQDQCFLDAAKEAAQLTRFNFSTAEKALQQGYIVYHFVAQ